MLRQPAAADGELGAELDPCQAVSAIVSGRGTGPMGWNSVLSGPMWEDQELSDPDSAAEGRQARRRLLHVTRNDRGASLQMGTEQPDRPDRNRWKMFTMTR